MSEFEAGIKVQYQNEQFQTRLKTYTGFTAQIIQHEIDHLGGVLIRVFCLALTAGMPQLPDTGPSECR